MKKGLIALAVVLAFILSVAGYFISVRNQLVYLDESVNTSWSQVENVLQRRADLIPNLVNTVKGYASHEKEIFENVAKARAMLAGAKSPEDKMNASNAMDGALSRLLLIVENYPQLKADANFRALQDELAGTENRISVERKRYNESVKLYNTNIRQFPASMVASFSGFNPKKYFEAAPGAKEVPKVDFSK